MRPLHDKRGFTLVEVIITLVILAVMGGALYVQSGSITKIRLDSAARKLAADIRYAQQLAMTTQARHGVAVNTPAVNQYTVYKQDDPTQAARDPGGGRNFVVDYTTGEFKGVTIDIANTTLPVDGSGRKLAKFDSQGTPLGGNNSPITSATNRIRLSYQGNTKDILIEPTTGRVSY